MFKIAKKTIQRKVYTTRCKQRLKRAYQAKNSLLEEINEFIKNSKKNVFALKEFFESEELKSSIKKWVLEEDFLALDTVWDGALALVRTIERETDLRVKKADMELLHEDLLILKQLILTAQPCP